MARSSGARGEVQLPAVDEDGGGGVDARGDAGGALGLGLLLVGLVGQGLLPVGGGDPGLDQDLLDDVRREAALVLEDARRGRARACPLSRARRAACAAGMELGCWLRGKLIQQSLTFEALSAANFSSDRAEDGAVGALEVRELDEGDGALAAALPLVDLEGWAGVAEALVVAGELDADLGGGDAAARLDGGDLREAPAVAALGVALEALCRASAVSRSRRTRPGAPGRTRRARPVRARRGRWERTPRGGRRWPCRPRAPPRRASGRKGELHHGRPCYTSARSSCKAARSGLLKLGDTRRGHPSPNPDAAHRRHPGDGGGPAVGAAARRRSPGRSGERVPELAELAEVRLEVFSNLDSSEMQPESWVQPGAGARRAAARVRRCGGDARDRHAGLHRERAVVPAPGPGSAGGADREPAAAEGGADRRPAEPHRRGDLGAARAAGGDGVLRQQALPRQPDTEGGGGGLRRVREPELPAAGDAGGDGALRAGPAAAGG